MLYSYHSKNGSFKPIVDEEKKSALFSVGILKILSLFREEFFSLRIFRSVQEWKI